MAVKVEVEEAVVVVAAALVVVATEVALALEVAQKSNHPISGLRLALPGELDKQPGSHQHLHPHHLAEETRRRRMDSLRLSLIQHVTAPTSLWQLSVV